jgi:acyl-coenzyme A thioesterase PaaI-like protein
VSGGVARVERKDGQHRQDEQQEREPPMSGDEARRRLSAAMRSIASMTVAAELDGEVLHEAVDTVESVAARMEAARLPGKRPRQVPDTALPAQEFFPTSPIIGMENPISPPVRVEVIRGEDGRFREIRAEVNFDLQYEGPPTCVHGGVIAETFDEVLGAATIAAGNPGMTGTLTVRYRKPTPLRADLRLEARLTGRSGRKIRAWAGLYDGETLTAEAEGIFVEVRPVQLVGIAERNASSDDPIIREAIRLEAARRGAASDVQGAVDERTAVGPEDLPTF